MTSHAPFTWYKVLYTRLRKFTGVVLSRAISYTWYLVCVQASLVPSNAPVAKRAVNHARNCENARNDKCYEYSNSNMYESGN